MSSLRLLPLLLSAAFFAQPALADDARPDHYRGEASETLEQAVKNFSEYNGKLEAVLAAEGKMDLEQMDAIHQLTYTLENALEKIRKDLDGLAETLEQVHVASEHADEETVRKAGAEYLKVSRTLVK